MIRYFSINSGKILLNLLLIIFIAGISQQTQAQTPAFPTAEGYGMWATGGRGGKVVEVTNLDDNADGTIEGSFRWALKQYPNDPLTVVFRVSGVINLEAQLRSSRKSGTTIAGQTAPGDGICIRGAKCNFGGSQNLIIRHLRFRIGLKELEGGGTEFIDGGSIGIENGSNWIIDHCTFGWSGEENMTIYDNTLTTVQWCIVHEGLYNAGHPKGARGYGAQWGGQTSTYHHNLLAHNYNRTPRVNGARSNDVKVLMDYVNNVNYNWGKENSAYGGDFDLSGKSHHCNMVNNYYKPGPARPGTKSSYFVQSSFNSAQSTSKIAVWYMNGNYMEGPANTNLNSDNYQGLDAHYYTDLGIDKSQLIAESQFEVPYNLKTETAEAAYENVLAGAGAFPRDTVDRRVVNEVKTGTAAYGGSLGAGTGMIDKPSEAGGYPEYLTYDTIVDADKDGMDDAWETVNGLDPQNPDDGTKLVKSGYTCLEVYLNSLVGETIALDTVISEKKVHDFVVAKDGSGDFTLINDAINAVPDDGNRYSIFIKKGVYEEKVFVGTEYAPTNKIISIIGENVDSVIITWNDYIGKEIEYPGKGTITAGGTTCPTMTVTSPDFYMENITVKNPYTEAQAIALYQSRDRQTIKNCKILGHQDTHRTKKGRRYFFFRSTIEGDVDFIYAGGTCYFYQCDIISNDGGYITAPEDVPYYSTLSSGKKLRYGFFFKDCDILAKDDSPNGSYYLGRPWQKECGSVFLNSRIGDHISSKGWQPLSGNETTACFAEYRSMNADGSELLDVSNRVDWSIQLTTGDVNNYMLAYQIFNKVSSSTEFNPVPLVVAPEAPTWLNVDGNSLKWTPVINSKGYVIYANGSAIGFNKAALFVDTLSYDTPPVYTVRTVGSLGNLSTINAESEDFTEDSINVAINEPLVVSGINERINSSNDVFKVYPNPVSDWLYFESKSDISSFELYHLTGKLMLSGSVENGSNMIKVSGLASGIYLLKAVAKNQQEFFQKIIKK